jgi:hypothetical protein
MAKVSLYSYHEFGWGWGGLGRSEPTPAGVQIEIKEGWFGSKGEYFSQMQVRSQPLILADESALHRRTRPSPISLSLSRGSRAHSRE